MTRARSVAVLSVVAASCLLSAAAHAQYARPWGAGTGRAGHAELMFGFGSMTSQTGSLDINSTLDTGSGTTYDLRFQMHFTDNLGIQVEGMGMRESTRLDTPGFLPFFDDTTTRFFLVNALFDLMPGPITPYVAIGVGSYSRRGPTFADVNGDVFITDDHGSAFDVAFGFEGHSHGPLVWSLEGRYMNYKFSEFLDTWNRYQFTGHLGFRF